MSQKSVHNHQHDLLLPEISGGQLSVGGKRTEMCVCMCVQNPYVGGASRGLYIEAALHVQSGLHTHIHTRICTVKSFFLQIQGGASQSPYIEELCAYKASAWRGLHEIPRGFMGAL